MVMLSRTINAVGIYCFNKYTFLISNMGPKIRKPITELIGNKVLKDLPMIASDVEQIEKKKANASRIGKKGQISDMLSNLGF